METPCQVGSLLRYERPIWLNLQSLYELRLAEQKAREVD